MGLIPFCNIKHHGDQLKKQAATIASNSKSSPKATMLKQEALPSITARISSPAAMAKGERCTVTWTHEIFSLLTLTMIKSVIHSL